MVEGVKKLLVVVLIKLPINVCTVWKNPTSNNENYSCSTKVKVIESVINKRLFSYLQHLPSRLHHSHPLPRRPLSPVARVL